MKAVFWIPNKQTKGDEMDEQLKTAQDLLLADEELARVPGKADYFVTSMGRLLSTKVGRELKAHRHKVIGGRSYTLPQVIYEAFKSEPVPAGHTVKSVDPTSKYPYALDKLEVVPKGTCGPENKRGKLTADDVRQIRTRYGRGECSYADLANEHGVSRENIRQVVKRETWKHVS